MSSAAESDAWLEDNQEYSVPPSLLMPQPEAGATDAQYTLYSEKVWDLRTVELHQELRHGQQRTVLLDSREHWASQLNFELGVSAAG